jgi:putative spermidine/putrescine transport system permease protein
MTGSRTTCREPLLALLTALVALFVVTPMVVSVLAGLVSNYSTGLRSGLTLRWFVQVWDSYGGTVGASLS